MYKANSENIKKFNKPITGRIAKIIKKLIKNICKLGKLSQK